MEAAGGANGGGVLIDGSLFFLWERRQVLGGRREVLGERGDKEEREWEKMGRKKKKRYI